MKKMMLILLFLTACSASEGEVKSAITQTETAKLTNTPQPTDKPESTNSPEPTTTIAPTPTPMGGGAGKLLFYGFDFESKTSHVFTINSDGSEYNTAWEVEKIIDTICFSFSPNGNQLSLIARTWDERLSQILITDPEFSQQPIMIDDDIDPYRSLEWSFDSKYLAFVANKNDSVNLFVADNYNATISPIFGQTIYREGGFGGWSPDGNQLLISDVADNSWEIFLYDADQMTLERIAPHPASDRDPIWSPDGKYISFKSNRDRDYRWDQIYLMDRDGSNIRNIVNDHETDGRFHSWSPDGSRIAYLTQLNNAKREWSIYTIKPDGSGLVRVSGDIFNPYNIKWTKDGKYLIFSLRDWDALYNPVTHYVTDSDGSTTPRMLHEWVDKDNDWSPDAISPDGKMFVFHNENKVYLTTIQEASPPELLIELDPSFSYYCFTWQP